MAQNDWSSNFTARIGTTVKDLRKIRGLSAQDLSAATGELGEEIPRQVITNLENGRRASVSIAEVVLLAQALQVSALDLIYPPARAGVEIDFLPLRRMYMIDARDAFAGVAPNDQRRGYYPPGSYGAVKAVVSAERSLSGLLELARHAADGEESVIPLVRSAAEGLEMLQVLRGGAEAAGVILPPLSPMVQDALEVRLDAPDWEHQILKITRRHPEEK